MKFAAVVAVTAFAAVVTASGPAAGCLQTYIVKDGDGCEGIAASFSLTPDAFYTMNPGLHHAGDHLCDNLDNGKPYCVCMSKPCAQQKAVSSAAPTSVVPATASTVAASTKAAISSVATKVSASSSMSMSTMDVPSGSAAANASVSASGSAAGASTTVAKSAGEKVVSSIAMVALIAGAASVLAF